MTSKVRASAGSTAITGADGRAVPDATSRRPCPGDGLGWVVTWPGLRADQMRAEFPFEEVEEGFDLGGWFGWPQVTVGAAQRRDVVLVNDFQCPPVLGAFVTVTVDQGADGVGAAELFGQDLQAGAGDQGPPAVTGGGHQVPRGEGFQRLVHGGPGQPGRPW